MDELQDSINNVPVREVPSSASDAEIPVISNIEIKPIVSPESVTSNSNVVQEDESTRQGLQAEINALNANSGLVDENGFIITHTIEGVTPNPANSLANNLLAKISKS